MANHIVSEKMEFFYSENFSLDLLFKELEQRFSYQQVAFINAYNYIKDFFDKNKHSTINAMFFDSINAIEPSQETACVVCCEIDSILECNAFCQKNCINLVVYSNQYIPLTYFCKYTENINVLGVILNNAEIEKDVKCFALNMLFDVCGVEFGLLENKLNNIYFNEPVDEKSEKISEKLQKITDYYTKNAKFLELRPLEDLYYELVSLMHNQNGNLNFESLKYNKNMFTSFVLTQTLTKLYQLFNLNITPNLTSYPVIDNLPYNNLQTGFEIVNEIDDSKFWYIQKRFCLSVSTLINQTLERIENIKHLCNEIDIMKMYSLSTNLAGKDIKNLLKTLILNYNGNSFAKIIYRYGYLEFDSAQKNRHI